MTMRFFVLSVLMLATAAYAAGDAVWGNDVRHGSCVTGNGTPGDRQDYWTLAFARKQKDLPNMPKNSKYKDDWNAFLAAYPNIKNNLPAILKDLKGHVDYEKGPWKNIDPKNPFTRICVPSAAGVASGELKPTDFNFHFNPTGTKTDLTATLFYKGLIRDNKVWLPAGIGKARH